MPAIKTPYLRRPGAAALMLMSLVPAAALADTEAVCRTVAERYAAGHAATPEPDPLALFKKIHDPRVTIADPIKNVGSLEDLIRWARSQNPPLAIPKALQKKIGHRGTGMQMHHLPGTQFYAVHTFAGTAACYDSGYFTIRGNRAIQMPEPSDRHGVDIGHPCGVDRVFGMVDQTPVYIQESRQYQDEMTNGLRIMPWQAKQPGDVCEVLFDFAPVYSIHAIDGLEPSCNATNCDAIKQAALSILQYVRTNPDTALDHYLGLVTTEQRVAFMAARKVSDEARAAREGGTFRASTEPDGNYFIDLAPLRLPYVLQGITYVVSAGRMTWGWRTSSDWRVTFESVENGKLIQHAVIPIGVEKGPLLRATVSTVSTATEAGR